MGTFTPIAMKCTQEQFDAIRSKLKGITIGCITDFDLDKYLTNFYDDRELISNVCTSGDCKTHETWNEEIFLKACGIEVETLQEQLQKAQYEVKRLQSLIYEENKPKVGDWVWNKSGTCYYVKELNNSQTENEIKITDDNFIKMLNECSAKN